MDARCHPMGGALRRSQINGDFLVGLANCAWRARILGKISELMGPKLRENQYERCFEQIPPSNKSKDNPDVEQMRFEQSAPKWK
jgi:hypothetical protein